MDSKCRLILFRTGLVVTGLSCLLAVSSSMALAEMIDPAILSPVSISQSSAALSGQANTTTEITIEILGRRLSLVLEPSGVDQTGNPSSANHYKGFVLDEPGSWVRLTESDGLYSGAISVNDEILVVESADRLGVASTSGQLGYRMSDVDFDPGDSCGVEGVAAPTRHNRRRAGRRRLAEDLGAVASGASGPHVTEISLVGDYEYFAAGGGWTAQQAADWMVTVINVMSGIYDAEVDITFVVSTNTVYTTDASDPFIAGPGGSCSPNADAILSDFRSKSDGGGVSGGFGDQSWGTPFGDIAHLFTGRDLCRPSFSVIGIASIGGVCSSAGVGVSEDISSSSATMSVLLAHEVGHNFSAGHTCTGFPSNGGNCANPGNPQPSCSPHTCCVMLPSIGVCSPQDFFSNSSEATISSYADSRTCLSPPGPTATPTSPPPPTNTPTNTPTPTRTPTPTNTNTPTPVLDNLSEGKSATQNSTIFEAEADRAVDGNTNGSFGAGSVTHTGSADNAWWEVDLGVESDVGRVEIWNRTDCCGTAVSNYYVLVSSTPNPKPGDAGIFEIFSAPSAGSPTVLNLGVSGRYVRIYKQDPGVLTIAEVRIWGTAGAMSNLSEGKSATQISTVFGADASRAVDGITNGSFGAGSVTHTGNETNSWWEVDLGVQADVAQIDIWNRTGCCGTAVSNYYVLVSSTPNPQPGDAGIFEAFVAPSAGTPSVLNLSATGRYVRIYKQDPGVLTIAEVQVWGTPSAMSNLSEGQSATQISTVFGADASRAVDGTTNGSFGAGSVTHTGNETNSWWEVDLGVQADVAKIDIWNRTGCCETAVSNYYVLVSSSPNPEPGDAGIFEAFVAPSAGTPSVLNLSATGRYVRIYKQNPGVLTIAEVQVWGTPSAMSNLSEGQSATQISTAFGADASRAVDGTTNGSFGAGSVTHTGNETNSWWEVDLGFQADVAKVDIWNRTGCCETAVSNYYVLVSSTPNPEPGDAGIFEAFVAPSAGTPSVLSLSASGRYVRIYKQDPGVLTIAEVQVWGN